MPKKIAKPVQLIVEGKNLENFFEAYLSHLDLKDIQIQNFGGINELSAFLKGFELLEGFNQIHSVGIVRDAEESAPAAFNSVQSSIKNNCTQLSKPKEMGEIHENNPSVGVMILPDNKNKGMLETLLSQTFAEDPVNDCIDNFLICVKNQTRKEILKPDKARAHAFIATKPYPHVSVGVAAKKNYWDFEHKKFEKLKQFLEKLQS